jgi:hypothetical protein
MRVLIFAAALLLLAVCTPAFGGEIRAIDLSDGSTISGEVVSLSNGVYTVKSPGLGTIRIDEAKVRAIRTPSPAAGSGASPDSTKALQDKMLQDKDIMALVLSLQNDPDFQKVLQNPEIMNAVQAGDIAALQSNPDFQRLLNKAAVRDIQKKVQ